MIKLWNTEYNEDVTEINQANKRIQKIPDTIGQLTQLQHLDLGFNQITNIPDTIGQLIQLQYLYLGYNQIKEIPDTIGQLSQLKTLQLCYTNITNIPNTIGQLTQLHFLDLGYNQINEIPDTIGQLTQLQSISIEGNNIKKIPDTIGKLTQLQILYSGGNQVKEIPDTIVQLTQLQQLSLFHNQIKEIPDTIGQLTQLEQLHVNYNQIKEIPSAIINLRQLRYLNYSNNPIEYIPPNVQRFIDRIQNGGGNIHNMYTDQQNVHNSSIQKSVKDGINRLLQINTKQFKYNYLDDPDITPKTKQSLTEYCTSDVHSELLVTFGDVLKQVLFVINTHEHSKELKRRLCEEMQDAECKCFTGRLNRLVNCLSGFTDIVQIKLSDAEEIGNIISVMREKYDDIDEIKMKVRDEMKERGYGEDIIIEWMEYIE